ncbi:MBL fold metallo-hydrolase [Sphingobacterium kitahiroshimense]|uniref:MBL fold metallo-hydrolase n=1 Tax=Sphingobacterium kitahiroshimense TaxID=470446 RepID=A0ABV0BZJ0_9SPHI
MKIHVLKDGDFCVDKNKVFTPLEELTSATGLKMAVQPFLIEVEDRVVLLDAGLGRYHKGSPVILNNLLALGFNPSCITTILLSHLHKDHIAGLVNTQGNEWFLNFPDAKIYMQKREYLFAKSKTNNPSFDFDILDFMTENATIVWMDEDKGIICSEISFEVTGGHTPFHQVFLIRDKESIAFYGADNLPTAGYLKYPIAFKSDFDGKKAMEQRTEWEKLAKAEHWKVLLYHDMKSAILQF